MPESHPAPSDSNTSRPVPPANTGSTLLNAVSDASTRLLQLERRFDPFFRPLLYAVLRGPVDVGPVFHPFFRPLFDAVLRDPVARLTTALINSQRRDEGLKIAEERS